MPYRSHFIYTCEQALSGVGGPPPPKELVRRLHHLTPGVFFTKNVLVHQLLFRSGLQRKNPHCIKLLLWLLNLVLNLLVVEPMYCISQRLHDEVDNIFWVTIQFVTNNICPACYLTCKLRSQTSYHILVIRGNYSVPGNDGQNKIYLQHLSAWL